LLISDLAASDHRVDRPLIRGWLTLEYVPTEYVPTAAFMPRTKTNAKTKTKTKAKTKAKAKAKAKTAV
jgi:hypothetical protein